MRRRSQAAPKSVEEALDIGKEVPAPEESGPDLANNNTARAVAEATNWQGPQSAKPAELPPEYDRIVTAIKVEDVWATYEKLERELSLGQKRTDHGSVMRALDEAETNARLAHRLWMDAKIVREQWEQDNLVVFAGMRETATALLQREKDQKLRSKQITDADVDSTCAAQFPDEWRKQQVDHRKVKNMEASMENLSERWSSRCRTLAVMLQNQR